MNTGDVVRLGRVCYIVKENSIDLSEKAIQMLEDYAKDKHDTAWGKFQNLGGTPEPQRTHENVAAPRNNESGGKMSGGTGFDAIEDYFNT